MGGVNKNIVYQYLKNCEEKAGGYTGNDVVKLAKQLKVDRKTINRNIEKWVETDARFLDLNFEIGKINSRYLV